MTESGVWLIVNIGCLFLIIFNFIYFIKGKITLVGLLFTLVCFILLLVGSNKLVNAIKDNGGKIVLSYNADATVIGIGSQGITVEYYEDNGYGEKSAVKKAKIVVLEDKDKYQVGNTVTIKVNENIFVPEPIISLMGLEK